MVGDAHRVADEADDEPGGGGAGFADDHADEKVSGRAKQVSPSKPHDQKLDEPPDKNAEPDVFDRPAVGDEQAHRMQGPGFETQAQGAEDRGDGEAEGEVREAAVRFVGAVAGRRCSGAG